MQPTVYLCSRFNSTLFTTCCNVAITDDQKDCPRCRKEVWPSGRRERWEVAYGRQRRAMEASKPREERKTP